LESGARAMPNATAPLSAFRFPTSAFSILCHLELAMNLGHAWKDLFANWADELPRRGVLVTTFDEQILFSGFMTGESFLLIERNAPDTMGARQLIVPYANIAALKIVDVVKSKNFAKLGFEGGKSGESRAKS
jgi:hypothetical protein